MIDDYGAGWDATQWWMVINGWGRTAPAPALVVRHAGIPVAWQRVSPNARGGMRTPEKTRNAEDALAWEFKTAAMRARLPVLAGNLGIVCLFYRPTRQPIDVDNMIKLVCDAANKSGIWTDDRQATTKFGRLELDAQNPRTEIAIGPMSSTLAR